MTRWQGAKRLASSTGGRIALVAALVGAIVVCIVGVYALWDGESGEPSGTPQRHTPPTLDGAVSMDGRAPLTGVPTDKALDHPAITVKVSNTPDAHPQRGVGDADIVIVEPITGGTTRLAAIFHSRLPREVGPVRSLRPMDAPLIGPTRGVIANTMAAPWVLRYVDEVADLDNLGTLRVPPGTYRIDDTRPAPNHVFAQPDKLLALTDRTQPPRPYFSYAAGVARSTAQLDGRRATSVTAGYGGSATATWTYDRASGRWLRAEKWSAHVLEDGHRVSADNVLVLRAKADTSFGEATASMTIPDVIDASGSLQLFTGDNVVSGRWSKGDVNEPFTFTTEDGKALLLAPGTTWVECVLTNMPVDIKRGARR
jgi:Protein of unknown function (DUF3048) N-terminal domain/Protein of unknown function (DUF3048) C-terminal domain